MATTKSKLIGGNFLFSETDIKDVFIPEEFTEEQFMIFNMVRDFCVKEFHSLGMEKILQLEELK